MSNLTLHGLRVRSLPPPPIPAFITSSRERLTSPHCPFQWQQHLQSSIPGQHGWGENWVTNANRGMAVQLSAPSLTGTYPMKGHGATNKLCWPTRKHSRLLPWPSGKWLIKAQGVQKGQKDGRDSEGLIWPALGSPEDPNLFLGMLGNSRANLSLSNTDQT